MKPDILVYKDVKHLTKELRIARFVNKHGEQFKLIKVGPTIYMTGHEKEWDIVSLFNRDFNIFSSEELVLLGKALIELGTE